jgi:hypothetical protein
VLLFTETPQAFGQPPPRDRRLVVLGHHLTSI